MPVQAGSFWRVKSEQHYSTFLKKKKDQREALLKNKKSPAGMQVLSVSAFPYAVPYLDGQQVSKCGFMPHLLEEKELRRRSCEEKEA